MEKVLNDNSSHIAHKLLSRCHSPETTDRLFKERVVERPLLLRPTEATDARTERRQRREEKVAAQRRKSRKPKPLSAKEKRALCIYDIPKEHQRYTIYEPLHEMWCSYMREVLGIKPESNDTRDCSKSQRVHVTVQAAGPKIVSADFHGAVIEVVRSRCVSRVGLRGIVVKDTKFTFEIITPTNKLKIIPKDHSIFRLKVPITGKKVDESENQPQLTFEIHGPQFANRAPERATKKFKQHIFPDL